MGTISAIGTGTTHTVAMEPPQDGTIIRTTKITKILKTFLAGRGTLREGRRS